MAENIDFVDDRERELYAAAHLGEDAREFLRNHPMGSLLNYRAKLALKQGQVNTIELDSDDCL